MVGVKLDCCSLGRHDDGAMLFVASWILRRAIFVISGADCGIYSRTARLANEL